jgi:hypothetical protein
LQLFLRLWVARQKYEDLRPYGETSAERIRFHLSRLHACWGQVAAYQQALGLEIAHFAPADQFELIYVIGAFVDRELQSGQNTILDIQGSWMAYFDSLRMLSYQINPYEFAETCSRCLRIISALAGPAGAPAELIPLEQKYLANLHGMPETHLKMKTVPEDPLLTLGPV